MEYEQLLTELLSLSQKKEIPYSKKQLEKMSEDKLNLVYEEYKRKELDDFNEALSDMVIFKLDELMKNYGYIKKDSKLGKKLQNKKLFRQDLKSVISYVTPVLPFIGFLEGSVVVASEMFDKFCGSGNKNENISSETETGKESDQTSTDSFENDDSSHD